MSRNGSTAWNANCDYAGLVFAYVDKDNFWVRLYDDPNDQVRVYQVSSGAWTQKNSASFTITTGTAFDMTAEVRAGAAHDYAGTVPGGQVGILCDEGTHNSFDDFKVQDVARAFEADGLYFCSRGEVRTDNSNNNVIEAYSTGGLEECIVRRGFRGDKYVAFFKFKWNDDSHPGWLVRWLSPGDYLALAISSADDKTRLYKRESDGTLSTLATAASGLGLSSGTWYEGKVVIDDDPNDASLQQLRFWVDTDGDSDYSDETAQITTTAVDDVWSAGYAGLYRAGGGSSAQEFDDVKIFIDNDEDGILDAADDIQIDDDFSANVMSLSYDNNGNLTDDGVYKYEYDAWNRLVETKRRVDAETSVATYAFLGDNRRAKKVVQNCGAEETANDGGNTTVHFYYDSRWRIVETRNGSNQATAQYCWGTRYTDEIIFVDVNGKPSEGNDCNPDTSAGETLVDARYFYHQDRNWNVVALSEYDTRGSNNGRIVERYSYTPYGQFVVLAGDSGSGELGNLLPASTVGSPFAHQGLPFDHEKGSYQNRHRDYAPALQRFVQRDPLGYADGMHNSAYVLMLPTTRQDPNGQTIVVDGECQPVVDSLNNAVSGSYNDPFWCYHGSIQYWYEDCPPQGSHAFLCNLVKQAIDDMWRTVRIVPVEASDTVDIDNWQTDEVDLWDIFQFEYVLPPPDQPNYTTSGQVWAHIIEERLCLEDYPGDFGRCHPRAIEQGDNRHRQNLGQPQMRDGDRLGLCNGQPCGIITYTGRAETWWYMHNGPVEHYEAPPPTSTSAPGSGPVTPSHVRPVPPP